MIAQAYLNEWAARAPWPQQIQIEQDLILSRLIVEIARHELLGPELSIRGGTCLHKLHFASAVRYSEDLDYVRSTRSGVGQYLDALREVATAVGLRERHRELTGAMAHMVFDAEPTGTSGRIRVKLETNTAEIDSFRPRITRRFAFQSRWWTGAAEVSTFQLEELLATKLRALYQRRKGRDLFDLWYALSSVALDEGIIVAALAHYMRERTFGYRELADNLHAKLSNAEFLADTSRLTIAAFDYDPIAAADLVMERLGSRLRGAPDIREIKASAWRS